MAVRSLKIGVGPVAIREVLHLRSVPASNRAGGADRPDVVLAAAPNRHAPRRRIVRDAGPCRGAIPATLRR